MRIVYNKSDIKNLIQDSMEALFEQEVIVEENGVGGYVAMFNEVEESK